VGVVVAEAVVAAIELGIIVVGKTVRAIVVEVVAGSSSTILSSFIYGLYLNKTLNMLCKYGTLFCLGITSLCYTAMISNILQVH